MKASFIYVFQNYGNAESIYNILKSYNDDYSDLDFEDASVQFGLDYVNVEYALYNSSILYFCSHGEENLIQVDWGPRRSFYSYKDLYSSHINADEDEGMASQAELIYISACDAGIEFVPIIADNCHAQNVIGFSDSIQTNASCYFDEQFFTYYTEGYSVGSSISKALIDLREAGYSIEESQSDFCGISTSTIVLDTYPATTYP